MVGANVVLNVLFIVGLGMDVDGLALSTALTSWGNLALLVPGLVGKLGLPRGEAWRAGRAGRMVLASLACGAAGLGLERALEGPGGETSAGVLALSVGASLAVYALLAHLLGIPAWQQVLGRMTGRGQKEGEDTTPGKT
jgi:peptidoglycan biosynthesis protein MviN/MurJ (putative lipid II flippase)